MFQPHHSNNRQSADRWTDPFLLAFAALYGLAFLGLLSVVPGEWHRFTSPLGGAEIGLHFRSKNESISYLQAIGNALEGTPRLKRIQGV